jgi:lipopolysaccharide/colanic/teichoic acid biosynthesis glycosyltransferase
MKSVNSFYCRRGKRWLDLILTVPALVALSPILGLLAIVIRCKLGAPVLFRQARPGRWGQTFTLLKFRTMTDARDATGRFLPDEQRLTRFGRFLRATSLDELPELVNVLHGEMSLVGPRPLLVKYLPFYSKREQRRFDLRPGLTGWAQVNGRCNLPWDDRLSLDVWYVENCSLALDLKIMAITLGKVLGREHVTPEAGVLVRDFDDERRDRELSLTMRSTS